MITVFEKLGCPYCAKARKCLRSNGVKFESVRCKDQDELVGKIKERKLRVPKILTFPRVFTGNRLIGGADDLARKISNKKI
ncbi:glutaredoxin [Paramecium bursaria Chlorella virus NE-JV-1]|nr:glutaredoxin [Paramecium bursaria Chlorella virus NE-JV-1]